LPALDELEQFHPRTRDEWRAWLEANHSSAPGVWAVAFKRSTGKTAVDYDAFVEEALCFGWIDSRTRSLDSDRSALLMTPRRPGGGWSRSNKERLTRLERAGLIAPAGHAVIEAAKADGSWTLLDTVEALEVPADLQAALDAASGAAEHWDGFKPSVRKAILMWLVTAKRPETRAQRVAETARLAAAGTPARGGA
jgi:uncharacterized protein YdeI (YjbR/CyaY-like superfamily)